MSNSIIIAAELFANLCDSSKESNDLTKLSFIRKMPKGYWGVYSRKGKLLGKYKTKEQAKKRLRQIEFFKHKKASSEIEEATYSSFLRQIDKKYPPEILHEFRTIFKNAFDKALIEGNENPEEIALHEAIEFIDGLDNNLNKMAAAIQMGDPQDAGRYISEIIKFLARRISPERRQKSLANLRRKIYSLNEYDIAKKRMPSSSALGQAISLTKNLLMTHSPNYVRAVINSIVQHL